MIDIRPATLRDACYCAANMRPEDRAEIDAVVPLDNPAGVAWTLLEQSGDLAFVASVRDQPVACFGVARLFDHVGSGWCYGTNNFLKAVPAITTHCLVHIAPTLVRRGFVRLEVRALDDHDVAGAWLMSMGAVCETPNPYEYGRHGEMFRTYAWTRKSWTEKKARPRPRVALRAFALRTKHRVVHVEGGSSGV